MVPQVVLPFEMSEVDEAADEATGKRFQEKIKDAEPEKSVQILQETE